MWKGVYKRIQKSTNPLLVIFMKSADMHSLVSHATKQVKAIYQTIFEFNDHNGHFGFFWYHYHVTNSMGQVCSTLNTNKVTQSGATTILVRASLFRRFSTQWPLHLLLFFFSLSLSLSSLLSVLLLLLTWPARQELSVDSCIQMYASTLTKTDMLRVYYLRK